MNFPSEWRLDPLKGHQVLICPAREQRLQHSPGACPFCESHEKETTQEVFAIRQESTAANQPGWSVRVVPNRYPAVSQFDRSTFGTISPEIRPGYGASEVVIETPDHLTHLHQFSSLQWEQVLITWQQRFSYWNSHPEIQFVQLFRNQGRAGGASLEHAHSQVVAVDFVPEQVQREADRFSEAGNSWYSKYLRENCPELVLATESWLVVCPPTSRFAFESWIIPRRGYRSIDLMTDFERTTLADITVKLSKAYQTILGVDWASNLLLKSPPKRHRWDHWYLEFTPRTQTIAGWELATGQLFNTVDPARASFKLRAILES